MEEREEYYGVLDPRGDTVYINKSVTYIETETKKKLDRKQFLLGTLRIGDCIIIKPKIPGIRPYSLEIKEFERSASTLPPNHLEGVERGPGRSMFKNNSFRDYTRPRYQECMAIFGITRTDPPREESITADNFKTIVYVGSCDSVKESTMKELNIRNPPRPPPSYTYKTKNNTGEQKSRQAYLLDKFDEFITASKRANNTDESKLLHEIITAYLRDGLNPVSVQTLQQTAKTHFREEDYRDYLAEFFKNANPPTLRLLGGTRKRRRNRKLKKTLRSTR